MAAVANLHNLQRPRKARADAGFNQCQDSLAVTRVQDIYGLGR